MKNNRIIESWDKIEPSNSAHDRMLSAVLEQNRLERERKEKVDRMKKNNKTVWVKWGAVAACLCLVVGGVIFANNRPQAQQGDTGSGIDGTVPGGTLPDGVDPVMASIAVFPPSEKLVNVENAICTDISESSLLATSAPIAEAQTAQEALSRYLPSELPDGFSFEYATLYETTMKNGTKYNMLRVLYSSADTSEQPNAAEQFTIFIMNYRPDTQKSIYTVDELTQERRDGTFYLSMDDVYIGVSDDADLPWDDFMTVVRSLQPAVVGDNSADAPVDENTYSKARTYSTELLDLQNKISAAMANHELPFVTSSAIMENPDRLHVTVNTTDENAISLLKSYDATGVLLEIEYTQEVATAEPETPLSNSEDVPADEGTYSESIAYSPELLDLQNRISAAMTNHELPFVTSSALMENPDRLHITVNTTDENAINLLKSYDTTGKMLEIEYVTGIAVTE